MEGKEEIKDTCPQKSNRLYNFCKNGLGEGGEGQIKDNLHILNLEEWWLSRWGEERNQYGESYLAEVGFPVFV